MAFDIRFEVGVEYQVNLAGEEWVDNVLRVIVDGKEVATVFRVNELDAIEIERMLLKVVRLNASGHDIVLTKVFYTDKQEEDSFELRLRSRLTTLEMDGELITEDWVLFSVFPEVLKNLDIPFVETTIIRYESVEEEGTRNGI